MADVSVRRAGPNDAPAVGVVQAAVWHELYAASLPAGLAEHLRPEAFARVWRDSLSHPPPGAHALLVALLGAQIVGFAAVGPAQDADADGQTGEITVLGVHPAARHQGHGSRLLNAAVATLVEAGAERVNVWTTAGDDSALAFLRSSGFGPDGAHRARAVADDAPEVREIRLTTATQATP